MARRGPYNSGVTVVDRPTTTSTANTASAQQQTSNSKKDDSAYKASFDAAVKNAKTDEAKYQAAVEKAREEIGNKDVSRDEFKRIIDKYFEKSGASKTGREMRGENGWTDFVGGVNNVINGVNTTVGNAVDFAWDNVVGNAGGLISKDLGDDIKNMATGKDLALVPDIASDVALTVAGLTPVVVAKEAFRNADNFKEAATGKDSVTLEDLGDEQRFAKAGMGALALALSALPGVGKAKNILKASDKETAEGLLTKQTSKVASGRKTLGEVQKTNAEQLAKEKTPEQIYAEIPKAEPVIKKARAQARTAASNNRQAYMDAHKLSGFPGVSSPFKNATEAIRYFESKPQIRQIPKTNAPGYTPVDEFVKTLRGMRAKPVDEATIKAAKEAEEKGAAKAGEAAKSFGKKFSELSEKEAAAKKSLQAAEEMEQRAQDWVDKSTAGRFASTWGTDLSSFGSALRNFFPTFRTGLKEVKTSKSLSKKMQEANKNLREQMKTQGKKSKEITADDRRAALVKQFKGKDMDDEAARNLYEQALKDAGWTGSDIIGTEAGLLAPKSVRRTRFMPGLLYSLQKAGEDVGFRGNTSYMRDVLADGVKKQERYARAYLPEEDATGLEGLKLMHELDKRNPGSILNVIKGNAAGMFASAPMVPLAYQAEQGGSFDEATLAAMQDPMAFVTAMFPLFSGRGLAVKGIPTMSGRLGSYLPYAGLRSKDVFENYSNNVIGEDSDKNSYEEALANIKKRS